MHSTDDTSLPLVSPEKCMSSVLKKDFRETIEPTLEDTQGGFRPGRSISHQIFTLQKIFDKSFELG